MKTLILATALITITISADARDLYSNSREEIPIGGGYSGYNEPEQYVSPYEPDYRPYNGHPAFKPANNKTYDGDPRFRPVDSIQVPKSNYGY